MADSTSHTTTLIAASDQQLVEAALDAGEVGHEGVVRVDDDVDATPISSSGKTSKILLTTDRKVAHSTRARWGSV